MYILHNRTKERLYSTRNIYRRFMKYEKIMKSAIAQSETTSFKHISHTMNGVDILAFVVCINFLAQILDLRLDSV